jgi:hypothetical protein
VGLALLLEGGPYVSKDVWQSFDSGNATQDLR